MIKDALRWLNGLALADREILLPRFFIIGAPKSGTSSLFSWLSAHPEVSACTVKESCYFVDRDSVHFNPRSNYHYQGMRGYAQWFSRDARRLSPLDSTPDCLYEKTALEALSSLTPQPKVIAVLRKPSARAYSAFTYFHDHYTVIPGEETFGSYVEKLIAGRGKIRFRAPHERLVEDGFYWKYLRRWAQRFAPRNLRVFLFENLRTDPKAFMGEVCEFLELSVGPYQNFDFRAENVSLEVSSRWLHQVVHGPVSRLLPRSGVRNFTSNIYNRLNRHPQSKRPIDNPHTVAALKRLDALYREDSWLLAEDFGLDISVWESARNKADAPLESE